MINYSFERQKSRRTKKRPQRKETSYRSRIVNPSWPPKSTHNKYGSIDSPIRENRAYPTPTTLFPGPTKMVRHIILPTPVICNRLQLWYTPKRTKGHSWHFDLIQTAKAHSRHNERTRISPAAKQESFKTADLPILSEWYLPGGRIWSSFSLGPIPCVIPLRHHTKHTSKTLNACKYLAGLQAKRQHNTLYCLLSFAYWARGYTLSTLTLSQTIAQANARKACKSLLEYCTNIDYQQVTESWFCLTWINYWQTANLS